VAKWPEDKWDKQATKIPERMERIAKLPLFGNGDVSMVKRIPYEKLQEALKLIFDEELTGTENRLDLEKKMQRCNQESETARLQYRRQLVDSQVLQTMNSVEAEPQAARAVGEPPAPSSPEHQKQSPKLRYASSFQMYNTSPTDGITLPNVVAFEKPEAPKLKTKSVPDWYQREEPEAEAACKQLWAATHPLGMYIKNAFKELSKEEAEDEEAQNKVLLSLKLAGMDKALKAGGYLDWQNHQCNGETLLLRSVREGDDRVFRYLLLQGADPATCDFGGRSALHWAAAQGRASVLKSLVDLLENIDAEDDDGNTPLHLAALNGHLQAVRVLVRAEADLDATNNDDATPFDLAVAANCHHIVRHLEVCHADADKILLQDMDREGNIAGRNAFMLKIEKGSKKKGKKKKSEGGGKKKKK